MVLMYIQVVYTAPPGNIILYIPLRRCIKGNRHDIYVIRRPRAMYYPLMFDIELFTFAKVNFTRSTEKASQKLFKRAKNGGKG